MNNDRRKRLSSVLSAVEDALAKLEEILEEEREAFENMPESLQESDRGQVSEAAISSMEDAQGCFEDIKGYLESAQE